MDNFLPRQYHWSHSYNYMSHGFSAHKFFWCLYIINIFRYNSNILVCLAGGAAVYFCCIDWFLYSLMLLINSHLPPDVVSRAGSVTSSLVYYHIDHCSAVLLCIIIKTYHWLTWAEVVCIIIDMLLVNMVRTDVYHHKDLPLMNVGRSGVYHHKDIHYWLTSSFHVIEESAGNTSASWHFGQTHRYSVSPSKCREVYRLVVPVSL